MKKVKDKHCKKLTNFKQQNYVENYLNFHSLSNGSKMLIIIFKGLIWKAKSREEKFIIPAEIWNKKQIQIYFSNDYINKIQFLSFVFKPPNNAYIEKEPKESNKYSMEDTSSEFVLRALIDYHISLKSNAIPILDQKLVISVEKRDIMQRLIHIQKVKARTSLCK